MKTMRRKFQVLLIDEEGMLRDGLCAMINLEEDFVVTGVISGTPAVLDIVPRNAVMAAVSAEAAGSALSF